MATAQRRRPQGMALLMPGHDLNDATFLSVFCFIKNFIGTAAIDNKIEQAMDLVKNHLMFTVREEVEVLKLRISELLERISQLESENSYLRANASPEVLQVLNSGLYVQPGSSSQSSNCSPGKLSPR